MPRLFELAQRSMTADELKARIDEHLRQNYARLIQDMRDAGRNDVAEQLRVEAKRTTPTTRCFDRCPLFLETLILLEKRDLPRQ